MPLKHRVRYEKLLQHTRIFNRQYMITMTNILFHMHKQLYKLRRRTHRMEKIVSHQPATARPVIRIPRLTEGLTSKKICLSHPRKLTRFFCLLDQLSTICTNDDTTNINEETTLPDHINNDCPIQQNIKIKPNKRLSTL